MLRTITAVCIAAVLLWMAPHQAIAADNTALRAVGANSQPTKNHIGALIDTLWSALHKAGKL